MKKILSILSLAIAITCLSTISCGGSDKKPSDAAADGASDSSQDQDKHDNGSDTQADASAETSGDAGAPDSTED